MAKTTATIIITSFTPGINITTVDSFAKLSISCRFKYGNKPLNTTNGAKYNRLQIKKIPISNQVC